MAKNKKETVAKTENIIAATKSKIANFLSDFIVCPPY